MRLIARCPTKIDLESTFLEPRIGCLRQNRLSLQVNTYEFMLVHRPQRSSQYNAFPSPARDQCFTRLAKMRRNTLIYWTTADFANRETCSFIRPNDAFRITLLQVAKKKSRKLTDHEKQLLPRALISNVIVIYDTERIMGFDR